MYCITSNVEYELLIYIVTVYLKPLAEAGDFFFYKNFQAGFGALSGPYSIGTVVLFRK